MSEDVFKNIMKNAYDFEEDKLCECCGNPIGDFKDYYRVYDGKLCEVCFEIAEEDRL